MNTATRMTTGISRTAVIVAQARAQEHHRPDRLFADPLAEPFVDAIGWIHVAEAGRLNQQHFVLRTRFFDDYLASACTDDCRQVVVVAAGLDARAFRLSWPAGLRLFEVDLPGLIAFKEAVIGVQGAAPSCDRRTVAVDLRTDWPHRLVDHGFDPGQPTAWLVEGLMMYLPSEDNDLLLNRIGALSADGSMLAVEHINRAYLELPEMQAVQERLRMVGAAWQSTIDDPLSWLAGHGWDVSVTPQTELAVRHGRPVPPLTDPELVGPARMWLVSGSRRAG